MESNVAADKRPLYGPIQRFLPWIPTKIENNKGNHNSSNGNNTTTTGAPGIIQELPCGWCGWPLSVRSTDERRCNWNATRRLWPEWRSKNWNLYQLKQMTVKRQWKTCCSNDRCDHSSLPPEALSNRNYRFQYSHSWSPDSYQTVWFELYICSNYWLIWF